MVIKHITRHIKRGFNILSSPKEEFSKLSKITFEDVLGYYMSMLIGLAFVSGVFSFLFSVGQAAYFDLFLNVDIQYQRMLNYSLGKSTSLVFFYLFAGTFILFVLSIILKPLFTRVKYMDMLKIIFYSLSPFLIFGWLPFSILPLFVWCIFLFITGVKFYRAGHIIKGSLSQRY